MARPLLSEQPKAASPDARTEDTGSLAYGRWVPLIFAVVLFSLNNLNLLRAWLKPPAGWQPMYVIRNIDIAQHLTWINWMRNHWLAPDFHASVVTAPALFSPLMWILARFAELGIDEALVYTSAVFLACLAASYALFRCLRIFTTSRRQAYGALLCAACALPVVGFQNLARFFAGYRGEMLSSGRDGFFMPAQLTCTVGTAGVLITLALVGSYITSGKRVYLVSAGAATGIFALFHPFEVFAVVTGATFAFLCVRWPRVRLAVTEALFICVPGIVAVMPYLISSLRVKWVARLAAMNSPDVGNLRNLMSFLGVPAAVALLILIIGPRMRKPLDVLLQCWFAATLFVFQVPGLPFRSHFIDGFAVVTGLLLIRQFSTVAWLRTWVEGHRFQAFATGAVVVALSLGVHAAHRYALFNEGNHPQGSVARLEEVQTSDWLRKHANPEELVLVPLESAPWVATTPIHSFASHWLFSIDYQEQAKLSTAFYSGDMSEDGARDFLHRYGINYVAVPLQSPVLGTLGVGNRVSKIGSWYLYYYPENRMQPYR